MKIHVQAKPGAYEEKVEKIDEAIYKVSVKEPPVNGLANLAILHALAKFFGVSQSHVRIVQGYASRNKTVEISG